MAKNSFRCSHCGFETNTYPQKYFYRAKVDYYAANGFYLPVCKECANEEYNKYVRLYDGDEKMALRRLCILMNLYYSDEIAASSIGSMEQSNTSLAVYMKRLNMKQYKNKCYMDTYIEELREIEVALNNRQEISVPEEIVRRFGEGFTPKDYYFLQEEYNDWITKHECKTKSQEELFIRLSCTKLAITKAQYREESTKDLEKTYQDLLGTANLQPKQMKDSIVSEGKTLSTLIKDWENNKPIMIEDDELKKQFDDVDHIKEYIDIFFKGGIASGMGLKGDLYSDKYNEVMDKYTAHKQEKYIEEDDQQDAIYDKLFGGDIDG